MPTKTVLPSSLPGVYFLPPRRRPATLPPLDVAAFVGYARRGPLHLPVAVEDSRQFEDVFGGDLPLARDERGGDVYAQLPTAVRSFFANGGRRCYAVRVAGHNARPAVFVLPGMVAIDALGFPAAARASASSEGRWADGLSLATRLAVLPLAATGFTPEPAGLVWRPAGAPATIEPGDVLRIRMDGRTWLFVVASTSPAVDLPDAVVLQARAVYEVGGIGAGPPTAVDAIARVGTGIPDTLSLTAVITAGDDGTSLEAEGADIETLAVGDILELVVAGRSALVRVREIQYPLEAGSPPAPRATLACGDALWADPDATLPLTSPPALQSVERLRFELLTRLDDERGTVGNLAFNAGGARFWEDNVLLESSAAYLAASRGQAEGAASDDRRRDATGLTRGARLTGDHHAHRRGVRPRDTRSGSFDRVTLAGLIMPLDHTLERARSPDGSPDTLPPYSEHPRYLPLDMRSVVSDDDFVGPATPGDDDLVEHGAAAFLDERLTGLAPAALLKEAWDTAYVLERRIDGVHSVLVVDEVAMLAAPDAAQRPWAPSPPETPEPPPPLPVPPVVEDCPDLAGDFLACDRPAVLSAITPSIGAQAGGTTVTIDGEGFGEGPVDVRFGDRPAAGITVESDTRLTCVTPAAGGPGAVDVTVSNANGDATLQDAFVYYALPTSADLPAQVRERDLDPSLFAPLMDVQRAIVAVCQARSDILGLLSLPSHYRREECLAWQAEFRGTQGGRGLPALDDPAGTDLSYAAMYHPWLLLADAGAAGSLRACPPDGAIAGMIASRELRRGAWIAPANEPIRGVQALTPVLSRDDWAALFDTQLNLIREEAVDFRALSAHTLSHTAELLQISTRRLLIVLRKAAAERGMDYVFESNHERFREGVAAMLRSLLRFMFERGAFAGATPEQSYRVSAGSSVNLPRTVEAGQFIALVQVAPSQPAEFITVALTRSDEGALQLGVA